MPYVEGIAGPGIEQENFLVDHMDIEVALLLLIAILSYQLADNDLLCPFQSCAAC